MPTTHTYWSTKADGSGSSPRWRTTCAKVNNASHAVVFEVLQSVRRTLMSLGARGVTHAGVSRI